MRAIIICVALLAVSLAASSCSITLAHFSVPPQIASGQVFEVAVKAALNNGNFGHAACILQLPVGFSVVESASIYPSNQPDSTFVATRDEPALLQVYTAESGHYLASFSGYDPAANTFKVLVRAPSSPTGRGEFKVALAGNSGSGTSWRALDPPGLTAFAGITTPTHVRSIQVMGDPPTPFALEADGLLGPQTLGVRWWGVALGDVDGDGNSDLAYSCGNPNGSPRQPPRVWLSRPGTSFQERSQGFIPHFQGDSTFRPAFGDFDGDGYLDLAVSRGHIYFGNGGFSWTPVQVSFPTWVGDGVATGDIDRDGIDDVAFSSEYPPYVEVYRSVGGRRFTLRSNGLSVAGPGSLGPLKLADVTGDGLCDLIAADGPNNGANYPMAAVWSGDGSGNWSRTVGLPAFRDMAIGDVDGDGREDLVLALSAGGIGCYTFHGGAWSHSAVSLPSVPYSTVSIVLLDYDRDGWPDLVVAPVGYAEGPMLLLRNQSGGGFQFVPDSGLSSWCTGNCYGLAVGDIDGDSFPDLAAACLFEQPMVWRNTGSGASGFGAPCAGAAVVTPQIAARGSWLRGSTDSAWVMAGQPNGFGLIWVGTSKRFAFGVPILPRELADFGAPSCFLLAAPQFEIFLPCDGSGLATLPMHIPNDPSLARLLLFAQGAVNAPGANALGWLFTGGLATRIR